jgi:hypothetical protein
MLVAELIETVELTVTKFLMGGNCGVPSGSMCRWTKRSEHSGRVSGTTKHPGSETARASEVTVRVSPEIRHPHMVIVPITTKPPCKQRIFRFLSRIESHRPNV